MPSSVIMTCAERPNCSAVNSMAELINHEGFQIAMICLGGVASLIILLAILLVVVRRFI